MKSIKLNLEQIITTYDDMLEEQVINDDFGDESMATRLDNPKTDSCCNIL
jgi:hypothetical protein